MPDANQPTTICTYGEDQAPGAGCIKPDGHTGAHAVLPGDPDDDNPPAAVLLQQLKAKTRAIQADNDARIRAAALREGADLIEADDACMKAAHREHYAALLRQRAAEVYPATPGEAS